MINMLTTTLKALRKHSASLPSVCEEFASSIDQKAQEATENGEGDEVSALRAMAWRLSVAAAEIRKLAQRP